MRGASSSSATAPSSSSSCVCIRRRRLSSASRRRRRSLRSAATARSRRAEGEEGRRFICRSGSTRRSMCTPGWRVERMFIHSILLLITATWLSISVSIGGEKLRKDRALPQQTSQFAQCGESRDCRSVRGVWSPTHQTVDVVLDGRRSLLSRFPKPRGAEAWPPQATRPMWRAPRKPTQFAEQLEAANGQARLAWDLAVLIESGLVVPVQDGATIRYAVNPSGEPAAA